MVYFYLFSSYDDIENISNLLKTKYKASLELCNEMTARLLNKRPNCEEILERKNWWALNKEALEINDELQNIIASKERENEFQIYSILRSEINLVEDSNSDSSSGAVDLSLKRSRSPELRDETSQGKRRTQFQNVN